MRIVVGIAPAGFEVAFRDRLDNSVVGYFNKHDFKVRIEPDALPPNEVFKQCERDRFGGVDHFVARAVPSPAYPGSEQSIGIELVDDPEY
ncbi:hypothetical protein D3C87_1601030 [compost metagenome]